jgi:dinuclear metal center YbgI/SA1388 family protein
MHTNTQKIIKILEHIAPKSLAESWDHVGLMVGSKHKMVQNILLALELTESIIEEAIEKNIDLIVVHHPLIFKSLSKITDDNPIENMAMTLIKNDINLYVSHTNLDAAKEGTCQYLAELLGLKNLKVLEVASEEILYKVQVFLPQASEIKVKEAMINHGAGAMGEYKGCSFVSKGIGEFVPLEGSNPHIGQINEDTQVDEVKIETLVSENHLKEVIAAMIQSHPYEEPAYDIIKLENKGTKKGIGRVGTLDEMTSLENFAAFVKEKLKADHIKIIGKKDKKIKRVSVVTGAGSDYIKVASENSDVFITGDIKYHQAQEALQSGLAIIDGGHYETEVIYLERYQEILQKKFEEKSYDVQVLVSEININPFTTI